MRRTVLLALLLAVAWTPHGAAGQAEVAREPADWGQGVVHINIAAPHKEGLARGSGTGFVLNTDGYIATNHHVIDDAVTVDGKIAIYVNPDGGTFSVSSILERPNAEVVWKSKDLDLAVLKYSGGAPLVPVRLTDAVPEKARRVVAVGYPGAADDNSIQTMGDVVSDATVTSGVFSRIRTGSWGGSPLSVVQHSAQISWGNSGGPLFDECHRVIGVNTRLTFANRQIAPGVFFASSITELMRNLDSKNIAYELASAPCISAGDQMVADQAHFKSLFRNTIVAGAAAFLALGALTLFALRRPRERVVRMIDVASRSLRARSSRAPEEPVRPAPMPTVQTADVDLLLDGQDSSGRRYQLRISGEQLAAGAVIGREPPDPTMRVDHPEISRHHAQIQWQQGFARLRDNGSTNGTRINGRALRPRQEQVLADGDVVELGNVAFRVTLRRR